ncbi:metal ABC transporter solute-binding protein, Zn/Mn family [Lacticaseibacillus yichunensis]|uniref:Metal ABC transporter solute-binding protein, Zn/Mn family n=1 Tax=Lacticaseibacillus yichunensis TaxID=2486015 RepID=A0ABW4CN00_9LACO|nr:zinc ABC transporter substrate-binding protein [Lacticaseibacillus yichunensis]
MLKRLGITSLLLAAVTGFVLWFVNAKPVRVMGDASTMRIVTTNSILEDMTEQVVGSRAEVYSIVPRGQDPHEYEPKPSDAQATAAADLIFHNGLKLETGGNGWFTKLVANAGKRDNKEVFAASEGVTARYVNGDKNSPDPHAWLDIANGIRYIKNIAAAVIDKDPAHAKEYQANADAYIAKLTKLDQAAKQQFADIPAAKKLLVTSEGAFQYFSAAYDLTPTFIWAINTESQGTPEQLRTVLAKIEASDVPVLFVETSVSKKAMQKVSQDSGKPIYATLFTDSLAKKGQKGDTYLTMMQWNLSHIHAGLAQ